MKSSLREIKVLGIEMLEKEVKLPKGATSANVYLPKNWEGKKVVVIRID